MILHILKRSEWLRAAEQGAYAPLSLDTEGFIHCSTMDQLLDTATRFFRGQDDLAVLCIDEHRLAAPLRFEAPADAQDARAKPLFPHLHGPLNLDAVTEVLDFPCAEDGTFLIPDALVARLKAGG